MADKNEEQLIQLIHDAEEGFRVAAEQVALTVSTMAEGFRARAAEASDIVVSAESETAKRRAIDMLRQQAKHWELLAQAIQRDPVPASAIESEVNKLLGDVAATIAQMYAGRLLAPVGV